jgi:hypothetical protein
MHQVLDPNQRNDAESVANEAWFGPTNGRIMACEVPASEDRGAWRAVFVEGALRWETERDAVIVPSVRNCQLDRTTIGSSDRGVVSSVSQGAGR